MRPIAKAGSPFCGNDVSESNRLKPYGVPNASKGPEMAFIKTSENL